MPQEWLKPAVANALARWRAHPKINAERAKAARADAEKDFGLARFTERRACAVLGQHWFKQRKVPRGREDEDQMTDGLVALVSEHDRLRHPNRLRRRGWLRGRPFGNLATEKQLVTDQVGC
jgi:hypothetical protein